MEYTLKLASALMQMQAHTTERDIDCEEARWVERACSGDETAYRWLMERYRDRAIRLATHVLGRQADAEDIAQESFIQAFRQLRTLKNGDRFGAWLFKIVVHRCLDRKRTKQWTLETSSDGLNEMNNVETSSGSSEILTKLLVRQLLAQMSPIMRAALVLRELEGLEYEEIAVVMDIPAGTVKSRLNAARTQFRDMWTRSEGENA